MNENSKRITVSLPAELYKKLKIMTVASDKTMRDIIIEAIEMFAEKPSLKKEIKHLRYQMHRMRHDESEDQDGRK